MPSPHAAPTSSSPAATPSVAPRWSPPSRPQEVRRSSSPATSPRRRATSARSPPPGPTALDGRVDILVHNAAICPPVDTVTLSDDDLEATLAVNLRAPHVLTAALAPAMAERGHGAIVVIGSWMATVGHPFVGFYSATKAAEAQLARSWAAEFGPRGVRVNTVAPGATRTPINAGDGDVIAQMTAGTPAGRPGTPEEVASRRRLGRLGRRRLRPRRADPRRRGDHRHPVGDVGGPGPQRSRR